MNFLLRVAALVTCKMQFIRSPHGEWLLAADSVIHGNKHKFSCSCRCSSPCFVSAKCSYRKLHLCSLAAMSCALGVPPCIFYQGSDWFLLDVSCLNSWQAIDAGIITNCIYKLSQLEWLVFGLWEPLLSVQTLFCLNIFGCCFFLYHYHSWQVAIQ